MLMHVRFVNESSRITKNATFYDVARTDCAGAFSKRGARSNSNWVEISAWAKKNGHTMKKIHVEPCRDGRVFHTYRLVA